MAVSSGVAPHFAFINGILCKHGTVVQTGFNRRSGTFSCTVAMFEPGAMGAFTGGEAAIVVSGPGGSGLLMVGEIDAVDYDFVATTIHVSGRDKSAKLHNMKSAEKWQNKTGSDITQELVGRAGLGGGGGGSSKGPAGKKLQGDHVKLTEGIGFSSVIHLLSQYDGVGWMVDKEGNFKYGGGGGGSYSVNWRSPHPGPMVSDCLSLRVHVNAQAMKGAKVTVKSWHPKDKKTYTGKSSAGGGSGGSPNEFTYHIPTLDQSQADQHAKSRAKEHAMHAITVTATVVGDPSIDAGGNLTLSGTPFSGSYKIDNVHHEFGMSGYRMTITAKSGGGEG